MWNSQTGRAYLTSGTGYGKTALSAFDAAELDAHIMAANAVKVSSFVPPRWQIINSKADLEMHTDNGVFLPMAYSYAVSGESGVAASLLIGTNKDKNRASIIVEHSDINITAAQSVEQSLICVNEAFAFRGWELDGIEKVSLEATPRQGLYVCVLVAVLFITDKTDREV